MIYSHHQVVTLLVLDDIKEIIFRCKQTVFGGLIQRRVSNVLKIRGLAVYSLRSCLVYIPD
jgi:hypothetical protein